MLAGVCTVAAQAQDKAVPVNATAAAPVADSGNSSATAAPKLTPIRPWQDTTIKLVTPGTLGPPATPTKIVEVPAKMALFEFGYCIAVYDPNTKKIYLAINRGVEAFYILSTDGMISLSYFPGGSLNWSKSYLEVNDASGNLDAAIARFEMEFYMVKYGGGIDVYQSVNGQGVITSSSPHEASSISLRVVDDPNFFINGGGGRPNKVTLDKFEVTGDVVHMELTAVANQHKVGFWIDLKTKKIIRATVEGKDVNPPNPGPSVLTTRKSSV